MLSTTRDEFILQQLQLQGNVTVLDLSRSLNVSVDTIRRDLKSLEELGSLKYVRGGACLPEAIHSMANFSGREIIHIDEKRNACLKALKYVESGDFIGLNSGTTNTIFAQELIKRFSDLTVVTNNIAAANVLMQSPSIRTILIGGKIDGSENSTYGVTCLEELARHNFDKVFLSINAVDKEYGYSDFRLEEIGVIKTFVNHSKESIAIMDSSKIGKRSKKKVMKIQEIDVLCCNDM